MTNPESPLPPDRALDRLLAEIHLRVRQGVFAEATERLAQAQALAPNHPAVLEMEGDLAFAQRRYRQAESCYRQAFKLNPTNTKLEEKFATAVVKVHEPEMLAHLGPDEDESYWSHRTPRPPAVSALISAVLPGLGQLYNGDYLKGAIGAMLSLFLLSYDVWAIYQAVWPLMKAGTPFPLSVITDSVMHGGYAIITLLYFILWFAAIADAIIVAKETSEDQQRYTATRPPDLLPGQKK